MNHYIYNKLIETCPVFSSSIIILCAAIILWQYIIRRMAPQDDQPTSGETAIVRALIIARGPDGATLQQIKKDYTEQIGGEINHGDNDQELRDWLESVEFVSSRGVINGEIVYVSNAPRQSHLTKLINKQNTRRTKQLHCSRRNSSMLNESEKSSNTTPTTWANSLIFRRRRLASSTFLGNPPTFKNTLSQTFTPDQSAHHFQPQQIKAAKRRSPLRYDGSFLNSFHHQEEHDKSEIKWDDNNNNNNLNNKNISSCSNLSRLTDRFIKMEDHVDPFLPEFYKCVLVGDNFLLNLAVMDMGFRMTNRNRIMQSGFCVSGQTIAEATRNIGKLSANQIILLNIGSVDIVQGKELIDMIYAMIRLCKLCVMNEITPILTTILPLANCRLGNRAAVTDGFNEFLIKNPFNFPVIELHETFTNSEGSMDHHYYQQSPRFVSGMRKPLVFWNRMGRQKIMKTLTQELGSAILKILIK